MVNLNFRLLKKFFKEAKHIPFYISSQAPVVIYRELKTGGKASKIERAVAVAIDDSG